MLGEAALDDQRHERFAQLALHAALVGEEEVLHQLLRERAAALHGVSAAHVDPQRAGDAVHIDAVVLVEVLVLDVDDGAQRAAEGRRRG